MGICPRAGQLVEAAIGGRNGSHPGSTYRHGAGDQGNTIGEGLKALKHGLLSPDSRQIHVDF